jgi:hypothetical protein
VNLLFYETHHYIVNQLLSEIQTCHVNQKTDESHANFVNCDIYEFLTNFVIRLPNETQRKNANLLPYETHKEETITMEMQK